MLHFDFAFVKCPLQMPLPPPLALLPVLNQVRTAAATTCAGHERAPLPPASFYRRVPYSAPHTTKRLGSFQRVIQAAVIAHRAMLWEETVRASASSSASSASSAAP